MADSLAEVLNSTGHFDMSQSFLPSIAYDATSIPESDEDRILKRDDSAGSLENTILQTTNINFPPISPRMVT